jgi:hypothetical protein
MVSRDQGCDVRHERPDDIAAVIPHVGAGHTLPVIFPAPELSPASSGKDQPTYAESAVLLLANLNCIVLDYLARQKVHGNHLAWYIEQLPFLSATEYHRRFGSKSTHDIVRQAVLELTYTAADMAPFACDLGYVNAGGKARAPFVRDEERRLKLRAKIDAVYFHLYGVTDHDDVSYIYSTFPIVEREDKEVFGTYRSRDLCLAFMRALAAGDPPMRISGFSGSSWNLFQILL